MTGWGVGPAVAGTESPSFLLRLIGRFSRRRTIGGAGSRRPLSGLGCNLLGNVLRPFFHSRREELCITVSYFMVDIPDGSVEGQGKYVASVGLGTDSGKEKISPVKPQDMGEAIQAPQCLNFGQNAWFALLAGQFFTITEPMHNVIHRTCGAGFVAAKAIGISR